MSKEPVTIVGGIPRREHSKLHKRLIKRHGKASMCEGDDCQNKNPKRFEWALKKGRQYSDNPDDYLQLCPSCHRKYDFTEEIRAKLREKKAGEKHNKAKLNNEDVKKVWELIEAGVSNKIISIQFKVSPTAICNIRTGKTWAGSKPSPTPSPAGTEGLVKALRLCVASLQTGVEKDFAIDVAIDQIKKYPEINH